MSIQSCAGAGSAVYEILDLIKKNKAKDEEAEVILKEVIKKCEYIKEAADSGWY